MARRALLTLLLIFGWVGVEAQSVSFPGSAQTSDDRLQFIQGWVRQLVPECPLNVTLAASDAFLRELRERQPQKYEQLLNPSFATRGLDSMLLRHVSAELKAPEQAVLRENVARRRVQAMMAAEDGAGIVLPTVLDPLLAKIKESSSVQYRRLLEGRIEDDDLSALLAKARRSREPGADAAKAGEPAKPKVLTAAEIVSAFSRQNQSGSALSRMRAYTIEGRLKTPAGEEQKLILHRMRPNRFRLVVQSADVTRLLVGCDGDRFWQQVPGQDAITVRPDAVGARRYLAEFVDPLFAEEGAGCTFERLPDGVDGAGPVFRIQVRRPDRSGFIARIDQKSFREIGRENDDGSVAVYSDFREIEGVTFSFKESVRDSLGRETSFEVQRVSTNPGLVQRLFEPAAVRSLDYSALERALASADPRAVEGKGR